MAASLAFCLAVVAAFACSITNVKHDPCTNDASARRLRRGSKCVSGYWGEPS